MTLFRLGARRHPTERKWTATENRRIQKTARAVRSPDEVTRRLIVGNTMTDKSLDSTLLTATSVVTAGTVNSPAAYTLR